MKHLTTEAYSLIKSRPKINFDGKGPREHHKVSRQEFEDHGRGNVEWMPTEAVHDHREFDRHLDPGGKERIATLKESIKQQGLREPLILAYNKVDRSALLTEGNHRLQALKELGHTEIPVRASRVHDHYLSRGSRSPKPVTGVEPDRSGYVRGDLYPSEIGLPGKKQGE